MLDAGERALLAELEKERAASEKRRNRHLLWLVLGFSPAAAIPLLGFLAEGSVLLLAIAFGVVAWEGVRAYRADKEVEAIDEEIGRLSLSRGSD